MERAAAEIRRAIAERNSEIIAKLQANPAAWKTFLDGNEETLAHYFGNTIGDCVAGFLDDNPLIDVHDLLDQFPRDIDA